MLDVAAGLRPRIEKIDRWAVVVSDREARLIATRSPHIAIKTQLSDHSSKRPMPRAHEVSYSVMTTFSASGETISG